VRDTLRATGREQDWINLQGLVYGRRILEAPPFPGVLAFFTQARAMGHELCIISHKTRFPVGGDAVNLHDAAEKWLEKQGFFDPERVGLSREHVYFELTKDAKLQRIAACGCDHFVDDLPEFLAEETFPKQVVRWLIHSGGTASGDEDQPRPVGSWDDARVQLLEQRVRV
jgi:hypothetical protein